MIPPVGSTCRFVFTSKFDLLNGVYRVKGHISFTDAIAAAVDFVESLYTPVGLNRTDYDQDYSSYRTDTVLVLQSATDPTLTINVPQTILLKIPDPTIKEFLPLQMLIALGVHENTQSILPLLQAIDDLVEAHIGVKGTTRVITNPDRKIYLTQDEYDTLDAARKANIAASPPLSIQVKKLIDQNTQLAARCAEYEALILSNSTS